MVGVAPAANAPSDFDPLDMRNALSGSEDADTAHSVPEEMAKALANLTSNAGEAPAPMTMRMPGQSELQNESPTRIVPPLDAERESMRPNTDFQSTMMLPDLDQTIGGDAATVAPIDAAVVAPIDAAPVFDGHPPAPSSLARAAQTSFDHKPLERKPLVTTVMMSPISKIALPSSRGSNLPVRASRMPSQAGASPSNTPPRALSQEQADMPAPSDGATVMVSPDRELERGPDTALPPPPAAPPPLRPSPPETVSVFAVDAPAIRALAGPAPSAPSAKFDGTLESAANERLEESTMMVLPEEIIEGEPSMITIAAPSQPSDGGTMMIAAVNVKHAASIVPEPEPELPKTQPPRIKSNLKTSIGIAPPVFSNPPPMPAPSLSPGGPMISPTPIVSIAPAPPPPQHVSITPAIPPAGAPVPALSSLPVRPTVQLHQMTQSMPPPVPKPIAQTPVMPAAMRASYAQLPPHQWPAEQNMPIPAHAAPQGSIGPMSDPHRPLTYSVFDPAELANVVPRSPSMPSRASFSDQKPAMSTGIKVGLAALAICLVAGTAGAIVLGTAEDTPSAHPATSASGIVTSASALVPIPVPTPTEIVSAVPPPDPPPSTTIGDPTSTPTAPTAPTGKRRPKNPPPGGVPPNPFASGMPGKRK